MTIRGFIYHVNNYCNLHCEHCSDLCNMPLDKSSEWLERRVKWDVPLEEVELFCKRFEGIDLGKRVVLTGGEPTALPVEKLNAVIDVFYAHRRRVVLLTNGYNVFGVGKAQLRKCAIVKLDDHGINHEHIEDCIKYLKKIGANPVHIYTLHHYDLGATRKLEINRGGHCHRSTLLSQVEVTVKQGVVYPCCAMASFDNYNNDRRMHEELTMAGWSLENQKLLETIKNFKETLPAYVFEQCENSCWWPHKRILGKIKITKKQNDIIRKAAI